MQAVMDDLVWMNGQVMRVSEARVGIEERGFNFADGVYEVVRFYRGKPFTLKEHLERLERSACEIKLELPLMLDALGREMTSLIARSGIAEGMVYLQLSRGEAPRAHAFPASAKPTLFFYTRQLEDPWRPGEGPGCSLISVKDERWSRCYIKSIALLPNILAKQEAISGGHDEAVFVHDGNVTECSASNVFIVRAGRVYTCPVGAKVLPGITRLVLQRIAQRLNIPFIEEAPTLEDALSADEIFITSTTREFNWVRQWDGRTIGECTCGPITRKLHEAYVTEVNQQTR